ncbi:MAG TPA: hypothetical protein VK172_14915 [Lentimicrobium sp.]|nr:hypothetical protein [Bacteroidales bacterium]HLO92454.1 hypothetical protein [Lentimicrobium sp.]
MELKQKRRRFNALLAAGQMMDAKEHILSGYGVSSTLDLTEPELDGLISRVEKLLAQKKDDTDKAIREWRHKCLRKMNECGINTNDWNAVNAFMLNKRICGKHLYELDLKELQVLHRKLHNVRDNIIAKRQEELLKAMSN